MKNKIAYASPEEVEQAFYEALSTGNADELAKVWAEDEDVICVHPTGIRLRGLGAIIESWRGILGNHQLRGEAHLEAQTLGAVMTVHHITETLFVGDDPAPHGPLHVTHIFALGAHGWRLVSRHASAADATHEAMLEVPRHTVH